MKEERGEEGKGKGEEGVGTLRAASAWFAVVGRSSSQRQLELSL